jgi:hypothetical protein
VSRIPAAAPAQILGAGSAVHLAWSGSVLQALDLLVISPSHYDDLDGPTLRPLA